MNLYVKEIINMLIFHYHNYSKSIGTVKLQFRASILCGGRFAIYDLIAKKNYSAGSWWKFSIMVDKLLKFVFYLKLNKLL